MLQHCRQQIEIAGQRRDRLLLGGVAPIEGVEGVGVIDLVEKQRAETGIAGIKIDEQHVVLHIGQLDGQIRGHGRPALAQRG